MKYQMLGGQCSLSNGIKKMRGGRRITKRGCGYKNPGQVGGRTKRSCGRRHVEGQVGGQCGLRNGNGNGRRTKRTLRSKRTSKTKRINRRSRRNSRNSRKTKRGNRHAHPHNPNLTGGYAIEVNRVEETQK